METLREFRRRRGWSQKDLADESKVGQDTISGIESGRHEPRPSTLRKLAEALDVEVADFFKELALPKAEAPETGPSLLERAQDAARRDAEKTSHAFARLHASEGVSQNTSSFQEDEFRAELLALGFPDEHFESFIWPLVVKAARADRLEQENAQLRQQPARQQEEAREETQRA